MFRIQCLTPLLFRLAVLGVELVVGLDNTLHELVAYDVLLVELHAADAFDIFQYPHRLDEARGGGGRQVDLCDVARDDHLRVHAQAGQEHLDLVRRRVLRLVEDNDGVVECPSAHEGERGDSGAIWITLFSIYSFSFAAGIISCRAS